MVENQKSASWRSIKCPVCERTAKRSVKDPDGYFRYDCGKCGEFYATSSAVAFLVASLVGPDAPRHEVSRTVRRVQSALGEPLRLGLRSAQILTQTTAIARPPRRSHSLLLRHLNHFADQGFVYRDLDAWSAIADWPNDGLVTKTLHQLAQQDLIELKNEGPLLGLAITEQGKLASEARTPRNKDEISTYDTPFYVRSISIAGARCFGQRQTLDLTTPEGNPARWTILLGENGVGKTTLLQAIAALYPAAPMRQKRSEHVEAKAYLMRGSFRVSDFMRSEKEETGIDLFLGRGDFAQNSVSEIFSFMNAGSQRRSDGFMEALMFEGGAHIGHSSMGTFGMGGYLFEERPSLIVGYGATRLVATGSFSDDETSNSVSTLFSANSSLRSAEEWLLEADYSSKFATKTRGWGSDRLEKIKKSIIRILPGVKGIEFVAPEPDRPKPLVRFQTAFGSVPLSDMSLGYQTTLSWVVDLASRLFEHYPQSQNPLLEAAVVLIDEIDLHLHPKWQRQILSYLSDIFPRVQFIATTHSPLVVQGYENINLAVLKRHRNEVVIENDVDAIRNWRADQLLTSDLFDLETARPPYTEKLLSRRKSILSKPHLTTQDYAELEDIDRGLGRLPTGETPQENDALDIVLRAAARLSKGKHSD